MNQKSIITLIIITVNHVSSCLTHVIATVEPLYNGHLWGTMFCRAFIQRTGGLCWEVVLYTNCSFGTWVPGRYIATGLYSEVVVNRGSTVYTHVPNCSHCAGIWVLVWGHSLVFSPLSLTDASSLQTAPECKMAAAPPHALTCVGRSSYHEWFAPDARMQWVHPVWPTGALGGAPDRRGWRTQSQSAWTGKWTLQRWVPVISY